MVNVAKKLQGNINFKLLDLDPSLGCWILYIRHWRGQYLIRKRLVSNRTLTGRMREYIIDSKTIFRHARTRDEYVWVRETAVTARIRPQTAHACKSFYEWITTQLCILAQAKLDLTSLQYEWYCTVIKSQLRYFPNGIWKEDICIHSSSE